MRARTTLLTATAVLSVGATSVPALDLPTAVDSPTALEASVVDFTPSQRFERYAVTDVGDPSDPDDDLVGMASWRVVDGTGNCCETYPHAGPDGTIYDFGGTYVHLSRDGGETWHRVRPPTPLLSGEGTLTVAPNGDILGVGWDPYTGDHLQAVKYEAATGRWLVHEMPLHTPFYDRQWISVVPGPFTTGTGEEVPYVAFVRGGWPSKDLYLWSTDGLVYVRSSSRFVDHTYEDVVTGPLPVVPDPAADWTQPNANTGIVPLGGGRALASPDFSFLTVEWSLLDPATMTWSEYRYPDGSRPVGIVQIDGSGRIHNVVPSERGFQYRISGDGGTSWSSVSVRMPGSEVVEELDAKALASAGVAAVLARAERPDGTDRDVLFKLDITTATPAVSRIYDVGLGDVGATSGLGNAVRYDFASVAILPDGRVAASFLDSTTGGSPAVAIELDDDLPVRAAGSSGGDAPGGAEAQPPNPFPRGGSGLDVR